MNIARRERDERRLNYSLNNKNVCLHFMMGVGRGRGLEKKAVTGQRDKTSVRGKHAVQESVPQYFAE